jgi:hypothetical protein
MTLPTREQLYEETDRRYYERYPDGPRVIDPDDSTHDDYERAWLEIRDQLLNEWTDSVFYEFFPDAGRLDPGDPNDGQLIEYWNDIKIQICPGQQGNWSWNSPAEAPAQAAIEVVRVEKDNYQGGFLVDFSGEVDQDSAGRILWPNGVPSSASIEILSQYQARVRLDLEALQAMPHELATKFSEAGILTAD